MRNWIAKLALLVLFLSAPAFLLAQDSSSMIGTVTDATGAVVSGATVTLSNAAIGVSYKQTSNAQGTYNFPNVAPAQGYSVTFAHEGFSVLKFQGVALQVGITRTQDAKLLVGVNQQVEVQAGNSNVTLDTTDATIGNNFDVQLLQELPVYSRNSPAVLFTLQPGVAAGVGAFTGARIDQNSVTIDGIDVNDLAAGANSTTGFSLVGGAPVDSLQEFRGTVTGLLANTGTGSGGQFQLVTKSGTNQFHGNLNEYHRDTSTVANSWFNNNTGLPRTPLIQNQFGGNVGGRILRDKLFFFFDFNNSRIIQSTTAEDVVPLDSFRSGSLQYILANASNGSGPCAATSKAFSTPQCIGTLTSAQVAALDPQGIGFNQSLLSFVNARYANAHVNDPSYIAADGINTGGFRFTQPEPDTLYNYVGRVDYNLTPKQRIFARFTIQREDAFESANILPTDPITSPYQDRSYGYVISHIWEIGSNKVNQFYYGDNISKLNFPTLFSSPTSPVDFSLGALGKPYASGSQKRRIPVPEIRDDFNWIVGSHNLGFGGTFKFTKTNSNLTGDFSTVQIGLSSANPTLTPNLRPANIGGTTAKTLYDAAFALALGNIGSINSNYNFDNQGNTLPEGSGATRHYRFYQTELYFGDTWKVTKDLTVSYGLRYQLYSVPYETNGNQSNQNLTFDQLFGARVAAGIAGTAGDTVVPFVTYTLGGKANHAAPLYQPSYKDFAPRFAFAYNPSPKTVINGSASIVYDRTVINAINFIQDQDSFLFQNSAGIQYAGSTPTAALLNSPRIGGTGTALTIGSATLPVAAAISKPFTPFVSGSTPFGGSSGTGSAYIVDPTLKDPYSINLETGIQQEFPGHFLLRANWTSRLGRRLLGQADASQVVDFTDKASGQTFSQAFGNVTRQVRAGSTVSAQPWFENIVGSGATPLLLANFGSLFQLGDIADFANALEEEGLTPNNVNVGAQFAINPWITNKGFSSYNGLLVTLTKNMSQGIQFDVNYTWSHSIDNTSAPANYQAQGTLVNFICDAVHPRSCRGNSDFDIQQIISSDFIVALPFGRGKSVAGNAPRWLDEAIGGWSLSGLPAWRSGVALDVVSNAFVAGFNTDAPAIFNGNRGVVKAHTHKVGNGPGSQVQLFADPVAAAAAFSGPIGLTVGSRNNLRGPSAFTMDGGLAKNFVILPNGRLNLNFRADFYNIFNHPTFSRPAFTNAQSGTTPGTDFTSSQGVFGQIATTSTNARVGQFSLRLVF
jgi:hypothetical protein